MCFLKKLLDPSSKENKAHGNFNFYLRDISGMLMMMLMLFDAQCGIIAIRKPRPSGLYGKSFD